MMEGALRDRWSAVLARLERDRDVEVETGDNASSAQDHSGIRAVWNTDPTLVRMRR